MQLHNAALASFCSCILQVKIMLQATGDTVEVATVLFLATIMCFAYSHKSCTYRILS